MVTFNINVGAMLIVLILGHFVTYILIVSYTAKHNRSKASDLLLLSKLFQIAAWIMIGLRAITPSMILKIAGNATLFAGAALELIALLILKNSYTKIKKQVYIGMLIVSIIVFVVVTACNTSLTVRIAIASMVIAVLMVFPVYMLYADKNASLLQKVIATFYSVTILFLLCRAYGAFTSDIDLNLTSTNIFNTGLFLLLYLVMFAGSVGFILLDKEKADLELNRAACFDDLTSILNRRTFILRSKDVISLFARRQEPITYLLIDIDDFKKINDRYGHIVGDAVLAEFADTVRNLLRSYDLFGRIGGEEFAVLLPGAGREEAMEIAERLRGAIANSSVTVNSEIKYTVSVGAVTIIPNKETNVDTLYKMSDDALYVAKMQGKNRVAWMQQDVKVCI